MNRRDEDHRVRQTRGWIVAHFNKLFLQRRYDDIHVADIIEGAGVGRSTFYEHFRNKDEVLKRASSVLLAVLADAVTDAGDTTRIQDILEHFREFRTTSRATLNGPLALPLAQQLTDLVETRLLSMGREQKVCLVIPVRLVAQQVAQAQLALIRGWLEESDEVPSSTISLAILKTSSSMVKSLQAGDL
jgi:AcrR family transcriptional regulator